MANTSRMAPNCTPSLTSLKGRGLCIQRPPAAPGSKPPTVTGCADPRVEWPRVFSCLRDGVDTLRLALTDRDVLAGDLLHDDHHVVRRHACRLGHARVDVFH